VLLNFYFSLNMNKYKKHLFHIVDPSPWPFLVSIAIFFFVSSFAFYIHRISYGGYFLIISLNFLVVLSICWFIDICEEAVYLGKHTKVVKKGLKTGFSLFIISELMLFFWFFLSFFSFIFIAKYWFWFNLTTKRCNTFRSFWLSFIKYYYFNCFRVCCNMSA